MSIWFLSFIRLKIYSLLFYKKKFKKTISILFFTNVFTSLNFPNCEKIFKQRIRVGSVIKKFLISLGKWKKLPTRVRSSNLMKIIRNFFC